MENKSFGAICYIFGTVDSEHEYQLQLQPSAFYTDFSAIMKIMCDNRLMITFTIMTSRAKFRVQEYEN
jgi:hypothetical protein